MSQTLYVPIKDFDVDDDDDDAENQPSAPFYGPQVQEESQDTTTTEEVGGINFSQNFWTYFWTPMVYDATAQKDLRGLKVKPNPVRAWMIHALKAVISEGFFRMTLSALYCLVMANVVTGQLSIMAGAIAKAAIFAGLFAVFGYDTAFGRFENLLVSWWPSSTRAFAPYRHVIPYADFGHSLLLALSQFAFSVAGVGFALWVGNHTVLHAGLPSSFVESIGVVGTHNIHTSDIWLVEFAGSAVLTFVWLKLVVDIHGMRNRAGIAMMLFFTSLAVNITLIPISGASLDVMHYLATQLFLALGRGGGGNTSHIAAYIVAPVVGALAAWVGWMILAVLDWRIAGTNPGLVSTIAVQEAQLQLQHTRKRSRFFPLKPFQRAGQSFRKWPNPNFNQNHRE